jgi:hypothetical protein
MRKLKSVLVLFLSLSLPLSLSLLHADDFFAVKDRIIEESRFKIAFLYFTPLLLLENIGYTSSIYTYDTAENPDWTADAGVGLRASAIAANRVILQAEDQPIYSYYLNNKNLRSWSNRFAATAFSYIGPLNFKAGYSRDDLRQRPNLEFSRPYHYSNSEFAGEVDLGRHDSLFLTAYGSFSLMQYDKDPYADGYNLAERLDHRANTFGLRLNKIVFTRTVLFGNYELTDYVFAAGSARDSRAQALSLGVKFPEIGILQGNFQIGLKQFDPGNPLFRSARRPEGRGDVQLTLFERLHLSLAYELRTYFSYYASDFFYDNQSFGGGAELYLASFLKAGATYKDSRLKYLSFLDLEPQRNDRVRQQSYYLAVPFWGSMSLGFAYNIYRLTSDVLGLDYTRSFWGGYISYGF